MMATNKKTAHQFRASKPLDCFEKQRRSNNGNPTTTSAALSEPTDISKAKLYANPVTPNISLSRSASEIIDEMCEGLGERNQCNTDGNSKSGEQIASMDLFLQSFDERLQSSDIVKGLLKELDHDLGALSSVDARIDKSNYTEDLLLPCTAATASSALKAGRPSLAIERKPSHGDTKIDALTAKVERTSTGEFSVSSSEWEIDFLVDDSGYLGPPHPSTFTETSAAAVAFLNAEQTSGMQEKQDENAKLERRSTCDDECLLNESLPISTSSGDWFDDVEASVELGQADPSLFSFSTISNAPAATVPSVSPLSWNSPTRGYEGCEMHMPLASPQQQPLPMRSGVPTTSPTTFALKTRTLPSPSISTRKKRKKRVLDETCVIEPTDDDIKFGRGGGTNTHPGNVLFRQKALELWPWYKRGSKNERQEIAKVLVESVMSEGHRFVEKGKDGQWHEVIFGQHTKASQAFRDLHKHSRND
ncbi:hypothetical protein ACHAXR_012034 [Thalassiosira sp. AJA248-18]